MFLITSLILIGILALLCTSARNTKLPIRHRFLHIRYFVFTVIFAICGIFLYAKMLQLCNKLLSIPFLRNLLNYLIPPNNVSAGLYFFIALITCIIIMAAYNVVMYLLKWIWLDPLSQKNYMNSKSIIEKLFNVISSLFYSEHGNRNVLSNQKANVGQWFRSMRIIFLILLLAQSLFIGVSLTFGFAYAKSDLFVSLVKSSYMVPVLSYIILEQVELYFAADEKEMESLTDTEEIGVSMHGDYSGLVDIFTKNFLGNSLIYHFLNKPKKAVQDELFSGIQEKQKKQCQNPELLEALYRNIEFAVPTRSHYLNGLITLINGGHVAAFDSIWGDFDPYYIAYMQHLLISEKKALVLCDTEKDVSLMKERLTAVFAKLNYPTHIWRITDCGNMAEGSFDILVCTEDQLLASVPIEKCPSFFKQIKMVVVLDTYSLMCREEAYFTRLFENIRKNDIQFVFYIPENNSDICEKLREYLELEDMCVCKNPYENTNTNILFWRSESLYKPQEKISSKLFNDFGVAYTIAAIAAKNEVPHVSIFAPENVAVDRNHHTAVSEYNQVLLDHYYLDQSVNLAAVVHRNDYSYANVSPAFNIIYDEYNNLLDVAKTWMSYSGTGSSILNVISSPYMLRDYFACNMNNMVAEATGFQFLVPHNSLNLRAPCVAMLIKMRHGVTTEELFRFAKTHFPEEDSLEEIFAKMLRCVFGPTRSFDLYTSFGVTDPFIPAFEDESYHYPKTITLINEPIYSEACRMTEEFVTVQLPHTKIPLILPIHKNDVYNYYLPGQLANFCCDRYRIEGIENGVIKTETEPTVKYEPAYRSVYNITAFDNAKPFPERSTSSNFLALEFLEVDLTREINGYLSYRGALVFDNKPNKSSNVTMVQLPEPLTETKTVPCLHLTVKGKFDDKSCNKIATTLCWLISGALESFIPKNYKDVLVFSKTKEAFLKAGVYFEEDNGFLPDPIPSDLLTGFNTVDPLSPDIMKLFPSVCGESVQDNTSEEVHLYITHFSETDIGLITAISEDLDRLWTIIYKYLTWAEAQEGALANYLRLGNQKTPKVFDIIGTSICLKSIIPNIGDTESKETDLELDASSTLGHCSFCGKPLTVVAYEFTDGRKMCQSCHEHITTSRKEITVLLSKAVALLEDKYEIQIPQGIKVKFKSAASIRRVCGYSDGRVLGFYNLKRKEIWIERGGPEPCVMSTLVHELTHAWQHANINMNKVELKYIEGHSSYVEVECLRALKQNVYADFSEMSLMQRQDEYGEGYRFWKDYLMLESEKNIFKHIISMF